MFPLKKLNNEGFTLVEVIAALTILSIIIISFLAVFGNSIVMIITAGQLSEAQYTAQKVMENAIAGSILEDIENINVIVDTPDSDHTSITINYNGENITVDGKIIEVEYDDGERAVTLTTFVPEH
ncbi:MAG: hypothetical protein CVU88_02865 [Firmicutes bacterium HGW-Firmicutes-13]|nr:MAG: hypothetical protein CVU88_02865 [Firmicutes bacterium HGW-Firmicutes-13]